MRTIAEIGTGRLKTVLVGDKSKDPSKLVSVLKSEIKNVLADYLELNEEIEISILSEENSIRIDLSAKAFRIKEYGILPD